MVVRLGTATRLSLLYRLKTRFQSVPEDFALEQNYPNPILEQETGYVSLFKDEYVHPYVYQDVIGPEALFLQILIPSEPNVFAPQVDDLSGENFLAAKVTLDDAVDFYLLQESQEVHMVNRLATDANFSWWREVDSGLEQLAFREMMAWELASELSVTALVPATMALDLSVPGRLTISQTATADSNQLTLSWPGARGCP